MLVKCRNVIDVWLVSVWVLLKNTQPDQKIRLFT